MHLDRKQLLAGALTSSSSEKNSITNKYLNRQPVEKAAAVCSELQMACARQSQLARPIYHCRWTCVHLDGHNVFEVPGGLAM